MTIEVGGGGGGGFPQLAPDLNYISDIANSSGSFQSPYRQTGAVDGTGGLVTAISLSGKFIFSALQLLGATGTGTYTIKLTIDGQIKWNSSKVFANNINLLGAIAQTPNSFGVANGDPYEVKASLLLEVQTSADTSVVFNYIARPIL
jgi:hypothetical protein